MTRIFLGLCLAFFTFTNGIAATFTVSNINNSGTGSLREAINSANANPGADVIVFSVAGTLTLASGLPSITGALTIDATTAPGYAVGTPTFLIDGNFTVISATNPTTLYIEGLDVSKSGAHGGTGFELSVGSGTVTIKNCKARNRFIGLSCRGNANWTVIGNDLQGSGRQYNSAALEFYNVTTGTIAASDNAFASTYVALHLNGCSNKTVGDENASPAADILIKDVDGLTSSGAGDNMTIFSYNCSGLTFDNLDMSKTSPGLDGAGIQIETTGGNITVKNCKATNRKRGITCWGNANWSVTNNDLQGSGFQYNTAALEFFYVTTGSIAASGNLLANTIVALHLSSCSNKIIGDENAAPAANILIKDTDGLTSSGTNGIAIYTYNCSNLTFDNLDVSKATAGRSGEGLEFDTSTGTFTVKNCKIENRVIGVNIWHGENNALLVSCNAITNCTTGLNGNSSTSSSSSLLNNSFLSNNTAVNAGTAPTLNAQSNYWGGGAPTLNGDNGYRGNVDVSNHLTTRPGCTYVCGITCPTISPIVYANTNCQGFLSDYRGLAVSPACLGYVAQTPAAGTSIAIGSTVSITLTLSHPDLGAPIACSFNVSAQDILPPSINCPASFSRSVSLDQCSALVTYTDPTASDNCGTATVSLHSAPNTASGSIFPVGINTAVWVATDQSGNTATCTFAITVQDLQPPTITCPANIVRNNDANLCTALATYVAPTATDNCGFANVAMESPANTASGSLFPLGTTTVIWSASDAATPTPNTATCSFTVTVNDTQQPTITCPPNQTKPTDAGQCTALVTYNTPIASDNCTLPAGQPQWISGGAGQVTGTPSSSATFPKGNTTVQWKATDGTGLTKTCTFRVIVTDTEAPALTCPAAVNLNTDPNSCGAVVTYTAPAYTDNCAPTSGSAVRISGLPSGASFPVGVRNIVFQATDATANTRRCTITVTVTDNQPPTISCPSNMVVTGSGTPCITTVFYASPTASDNCGGGLSPFLLSGLGSGSNFPDGVTLNTWRAIGPNSEIVDCSFSVTVQCPPILPTGTTEDRSNGKRAEASIVNALYLSPNPASGMVHFGVVGQEKEENEVLVSDVLGRVIFRRSVVADQLKNILDVSTWPIGQYQVTLRTQTGYLSKTLIVTK